MRVREKPPLRLHYLATSPSGKPYRWGDDEPDARNVPSGVRLSSTVPGGFESFDATLPRKPGADAPDLDRLSTIQAIGPGGEIAWEGRLERAPKVSGDQMAISPSASGWQAALEDDQTVRAIYRDVDLSKWQEATVTRKISVEGVADIDGPTVTPDSRSGLPSLETGFDGGFTRSHRSEGWYDAQGLDVARLYYAWKRGGNVLASNTDWSWDAFLCVSDNPGSTDSTGDLRATGPGSGNLNATTTGRKWVFVRLDNSSTSTGTGGVHYTIYWTTLAVYGDNPGLTVRGTEPNAGFYASDIVQNVVGAYCPALVFSSDTIQQTGFIINQAVFTDPTTAAEIIRQVNRFHLNDWAVWEKRTFWYYARGTVGKRWKARINPSQLEETGPQIDRLFESVVVQYQDVDASTTTKSVGPPGSGADVEDASLKDLDPENPANKLGITRRSLLQIGTGTQAEALQIGARFLDEQKLLDTSGRAQLVGHVEDDRGITHPAWKVRAGDYISFVDASDTSYRRIVKGDYDHATRTTSVDLDSPPEGLAALLERLGAILVPLGLS